MVYNIPYLTEIKFKCPCLKSIITIYHATPLSPLTAVLMRRSTKFPNLFREYLNCQRCNDVTEGYRKFWLRGVMSHANGQKLKKKRKTTVSLLFQMMLHLPTLWAPHIFSHSYSELSKSIFFVDYKDTIILKGNGQETAKRYLPKLSTTPCPMEVLA